MRYINKELENDSNIIQQLYNVKSNKESNIIENGVKLELYNETFVQNTGTSFFYGNPFLKNYYIIKNKTNLFKTISELSTLFNNVEIETNFDTSYLAKTFLFDICKLTDIITSLWITIYTENKIMFCKPYRTSLSKVINSNNYKVIGRDTQTVNNYNFENENAVFAINIKNNETVKLNNIDSDIKTQILNVYKSKSDIIYIRTGTNVNPMDIISHNGINYLAISKKTDNNQNIITCIKEVNEAHTYAGSDITYRDISLMEYYSSNEVMTNKIWIDGRVIYRKVITFGALPNNTTISVAHGIAFVQATYMIISMLATSKSATNTLLIPWPLALYSALFADTTNVNISTNANFSAYTETYIILEYVK